MKSWKKILGLALSAALLTGTLAGCATPAGDGKSTASPSPSTGATGATPLVETEDMIQKLVGIPADTTMFTVDGQNVTAEQLYYWLASSTDSMAYYFSSAGGSIDWTLEEEGKSISEYILDNAKQTAQFYRILENLVDEKKVTLSAETQAELDAQIAANVEKSGAEEYAKLLQQMCLSDAAYRHLVEVSYRYDTLQATLFGEGGELAPTAEELIAMVEEKGLMAAKHILIKTVDDSGADLPEAELAAAKTKAEGLLAQLQAVQGDEQVKLFGQLMNDNSEDGRDPNTNALYAADGYLFGAGEMVQEFEDGTKALEYGGLSGLVKTSYGYHIILRLTPDNGGLTDMNGTSLNNYWQNSVTDSWLKAAKVEDSAEMAKVDVQAFYEKLTAYRESLVPAPTATPAPSETATPSETVAPSESATPSASAGN